MSEDVNISNCVDVMAVLPNTHQGGSVNKQGLSLLLLRAAYVLYANSKHGHTMAMTLT